MLKLRGLTVVVLVMTACASEDAAEEEQYPPPPYVVDTWTYEALWNTDGATVGEEVNQGGVLTLEKPSHRPEDGGIYGEHWAGKARLVDSLYVVQGPVTAPKMDAQGKVLQEFAGTMTYEGVWRWEAYESNDQMTLELQCSKVEITSQRTDLPGIICGDPLPANIKPTCTAAEGTGTLNCHIGDKNYILQKQ